MGMNGFSALEIGASAAFLIPLIGLLAALDDPGKVGKAYREMMRKLFWFGIALFTYPAGLVALWTALAMRDHSPRVNQWLFRRLYVGRRFAT